MGSDADAMIAAIVAGCASSTVAGGSLPDLRNNYEISWIIPTLLRFLRHRTKQLLISVEESLAGPRSALPFASRQLKRWNALSNRLPCIP